MSDKCAYCDKTDGLEWHHIWPISLGGPDEMYNMIRVCHIHHSILHEMSERTNISALTKAGLAKAKAAGVVLGRPLSISADDLEGMILLQAEKVSLDKLSAKFGYDRSTINQTINKWKGKLGEYRLLYEAQASQRLMSVPKQRTETASA